MTIALLCAAALLLAALTLWVRATLIRARTHAATAARRAAAQTTLATTTAAFTTQTGRMAAALEVHRTQPSSGFGDSHVLTARLRAVQATLQAEETQP